MAAINPKLRLYQDTYDDKNYTDVNRLANAMVMQSDMLSPVVTKLYGAMDARFPLMLLTEGNKKIKYIKSGDGQFKANVIGKPKKTSTIVKCAYSSTDVIGKNRQEFKITLADSWFDRDHTLMNGSRLAQYLLKITTKPVKTQDGYEYTVKILGKDNAIPYSEIAVGKRWSMYATPVGISASKGNSAKNQAPSQIANQTTFIRFSYNYAGNVQNKVMCVELPTKGGGTTKLWTEWEAYMHQLSFREQCENVLWYGEYNRDFNNVVSDYDINSSEIITLGSGLLEQIPNQSTYSVLSEAKIKQVVRDVLFTADPAQQKKIVLWTGKGGKEEFHNAMLKSLNALGLQATSDKFVQGSGSDMVYGAYFGAYKHVDGHTIEMRWLPLLDMGSKAEACEKHPLTGLPITSYDMYFVDMSDVDGEGNVQYVCEEGRQDLEAVVPGMTIPKGYSDSKLRATDLDASSVHFAKSLGIHVKNPINCFKLFCDIS